MTVLEKAHMKSAIFIASALFLVACGSSPSLQEVAMPDLSVEIENPNYARIYLFRNDQEFGTTHYVTVYQNDERLGMIGEDDYFCWERHPGRTNLHIVLERSGLQTGTKQGVELIDLRPGMILYGQIEFPVTRRRPHIIWLMEADGREALAQRKPAPRGK